MRKALLSTDGITVLVRDIPEVVLATEMARGSLYHCSGCGSAGYEAYHDNCITDAQRAALMARLQGLDVFEDVNI